MRLSSRSERPTTVRARLLVPVVVVALAATALAAIGARSEPTAAPFADSVSTPVELRAPSAPAFVPGLVLWLDGADTATRFTDPAGTIPAGVGDRVARWDDKSDVGNDATQLTLASRPTVTDVAGSAVPVFDGGDSLALDPTLLPRGTAPSTVFVVARPDATGTRAAFVHGANAVGAFRWYGSDGSRMRYVSAFSTANPMTTAWPAAGPGVLTARFDAAAGTAWADGGAEVTVAGSFSTGSSYAQVGANSGMQFWSGPIHEILVYDRALTAAERRTVEAWLAAKWGIALTPAAPTGVTATPGSGSVVAGWTPPGDAGGGAVTDYTVQYRAQGSSTWLTFNDGTSTTPSATITGLTVGTTYEVRIAAVNAAGTGPWSTTATAQAQTPWTPASLSDGLAMWLDASDSSTFTLASGAVAEWRDRSGNGRHVSQATAAQRPARVENVVNGRAVVRWSGAARGLTTASDLSFGDFDVFVAFRDTGVSAYERLVDHEYTTGFWLGRDETNAGSWRSGVQEAALPHGRAVPLADGQWHIVQSRRAGTTHTIRGDGGAGVSGTVSGSPTAARPVRIGARIDGGAQELVDGDIGEVVLVAAALGDDDRLRLEGYLAHRWGTAASLPADHPYRSAPPLTGSPATAPAAPTGLTTSSVGGGQVTVTWTAPASGGTPIRDYRIERRTSPSGTWVVVDDGVSVATTTTVSGLVGGTTYEFRVAAVNAAGTGAWSVPVTGVPAVPWTPADLPTGLALWLDATDASSFTLSSGAVAEWRDRSGWSRHVSQANTSHRPTRVDGVVNGQSVVRWTTGYRALRTTGTITLGDFDVFVAFRDSGASSYERLVDHGYVQGFWLGRDNANASSWRSGVQESGFPHGRAVSLADGQWHIVQSRRAGTTHTIRGDGGAGVSGTVSGATTAAQRIGIGAWADGANHQHLTDGDIGEVVLVAAALGDDDRLRVEGYLAHKWGTAASLPAGHPYRTVAPATSTPAAAPAAPGGLTATPGTNQVTLSWTAPADGGTPIRDYRIEHRTLPSGTWTVVDEGVGTATSTTVSGLTTGTTYEFRVAGVNAVGTGATAIVSGAPTLLPPGAPTGVTAPAGDGQAVVSWTAPADNGSPVTSTAVTATASGQATRTCTASGAATTCTVTGLVNGATYTLSVTATNAAGTGPSSTAATTSPRPAVLSSANGLGVWLDATDPDGDGVAEGSAEHCDTGVTCTAAGNVLTRWVDRSGLGNDAVQATAAMAGRYVPGMDVAVNYDANGFNRVAAAPVSPDATTFVVAQSDTANWNTLGWLMGGRAPGSILLHPNSGQGIIAYAIGATHAMIGAATPASITVPHLYEARVTGTTGVVGHFDIDGALVGRDVTLGITRTAGTTPFNLGSDDCCGARYGDGRYREVLWFSRALTAPERRAVREYLAVKWGLTIAPDRPSGLTATAGNGSVTLSWTASTSTGGSPVTDYVVQHRVQGATTWTTFADDTSTATTATVTGLTNGTAYELRVASVNAIGTGDATDPVTATPTLPWTPANAPGGTLLWLDAANASTITLTGGVVAEWRDRGSNARHAAQTTAANRPTAPAAALNGRTVIRFDGTDDHLISPLSRAQVGSTFTILHVSRPSVSQTAKGLLQIADGLNHGNPFVLQQVSSTTLRHYVDRNYRLTETVTVGQAGISALAYDGTAWRARRNGTESSVYTGPIGPDAGAATYLGNGYNGYFAGDIAEVVVIPTADPATIERVEGYLAHAWGLAANLPSGHPYRTTPPTP